MKHTSKELGDYEVGILKLLSNLEGKEIDKMHKVLVESGQFRGDPAGLRRLLEKKKHKEYSIKGGGAK